MDGRCAIPIKGDKNFEKLRSKINLDRTLQLTSDFDLHPVLKTFKNFWDQNQSAQSMQQIFLIQVDHILMDKTLWNLEVKYLTKKRQAGLEEE